MVPRCNHQKNHHNTKKLRVFQHSCFGHNWHGEDLLLPGVVAMNPLGLPHRFQPPGPRSPLEKTYVFRYPVHAQT